MECVWGYVNIVALLIYIWHLPIKRKEMGDLNVVDTFEKVSNGVLKDGNVQQVQCLVLRVFVLHG